MSRQRLKDMPLSAPVWVWGLYGALIVVFCVLAGDVWPVFAAAFSFQFWTFAAWRGRLLAEAKPPQTEPQNEPQTWPETGPETGA